MTDGLFDENGPQDVALPAEHGPFRRILYRLGELLGEERERWFLWTPVGIGCGIAGYFALPVEPPYWTGSAVVAALAGAAWIGCHRPEILAALIALLTVAVGFSAGQVRTVLVAEPILRRPIGPVGVTGRVEIVERLPDGARIVLREPVIERLGSEATPGRVRLRLAERFPVPEAGTVVRMRALLNPLSAPAAPGAFDFQRHAFFEGIGGTGHAVSVPEAVEAPPPTAWRRLMTAVELLREHIFDACRTALPDTEASITAALLNGEQTGIPRQVMDDMRASGLAHLLSVSGLHVALVAGLVFGALRAVLALVEPVALRWPIKKIAAVGGILAASGYLLVVGPQVPMLRSVLMTSMIMVAILVDRTAMSMRAVAFAAAAVLLLLPEGLLGPSFQMSFGAVLALIAVYEVLTPRLSVWRAGMGWTGKAALYFLGIALSSVVATLATTPFSLFHFHQVALYGVLSNMLAVPVTSFWVMPWGVLAYALMPMGWEQPALIAMGWGISVVVWTAHVTAELPGATMLVPAMPAAGLAAVVLGGLWLALWSRRWRYWGVLPVLAGLASPALTAPPDILVSGNGKLMAVRASDGALSPSSPTAARFTAMVWARRDGRDRVSEPWPRAGRSADGRLVCDALGCVYRKDGRTVALPRDASAFAEDCAAADAVVSTEPARRCRAPVVVDRWTLRRNGAHAIHTLPSGIRVESVRDHRGDRPWTAY